MALVVNILHFWFLSYPAEQIEKMLAREHSAFSTGE
jgi:hypothetical protein